MRVVFTRDVLSQILPPSWTQWQDNWLREERGTSKLKPPHPLTPASHTHLCSLFLVSPFDPGTPAFGVPPPLLHPALCSRRPNMKGVSAFLASFGVHMTESTSWRSWTPSSGSHQRTSTCQVQAHSFWFPVITSFCCTFRSLDEKDTLFLLFPGSCFILSDFPTSCPFFENGRFTKLSLKLSS